MVDAGDRRLSRVVVFKSDELVLTGFSLQRQTVISQFYQLEKMVVEGQATVSITQILPAV